VDVLRHAWLTEQIQAIHTWAIHAGA